jgi:hypothetical protein
MATGLTEDGRDPDVAWATDRATYATYRLMRLYRLRPAAEGGVNTSPHFRARALRLLIVAAIAAAALGVGLAAIARAPGADYHPPSTSGVRDELRPRAVGDTT